METDSPLGYTEPIEKHLLLLLYAGGKPVKGDIWLQKELFLISRNVDELKEEFDAYLLGPFSETVYEYKEQLKVSNYILQDREGSRLTEKGRQIASKLWEAISEEEKQMIADAKTFLNDLSRDELLVFIYSTFREFTDESIVREEIEKKKLPVAISLFRKHKVSLERASKIAEVALQEFASILKDRSIPAYDYPDEELLEELQSSEAGRS